MIVCGKLGMTSATRIGLLVLLSIVAAGGLAAEAEQEKKAPEKPQGVMHTIDARVTYSAGSTAGTNILAERQPGYFKVPAGQVARNFKYYFVDPKSNIERDKLNDSTIYCETTKQWVKMPADPATLELPPGDYKFVVGGTPGAGGTLNFRTFAESPPAARGEIRHAMARVIQGYKDPYSFAQLEPAPFTIPEGYVATKLIYRWEDPKTGRQNDQLTATTIYSVTRGGYVAEAKGNPDIVLPAGDYKLVCGGMAGASGVLTYRLIREDLATPDAVVKAPPTIPTPPAEKSGPDIIYQGVWLPEKYIPSGYRHYPDDKIPSGDPPQGNSSQSLWYGIPLQSEGGQPSPSSGEHPYTVFVDGLTVFKSTATAKKYFKLWKDNYSGGTTAVALGDEAYAENEWFSKEYRSDDGTVFRRDLNVRNIRIGRVMVGLRINGDLVRDFNPNVPNSRRFTAYETPTRDDLMRVAKTFVDRVREYSKDKAWLED